MLLFGTYVAIFYWVCRYLVPTWPFSIGYAIICDYLAIFYWVGIHLGRNWSFFIGYAVIWDLTTHFLLCMRLHQPSHFLLGMQLFVTYLAIAYWVCGYLVPTLSFYIGYAVIWDLPGHFLLGMQIFGTYLANFYYWVCRILGSRPTNHFL